MILKILRNTKSATRRKKSGVWVGGNSGNNGNHNCKYLPQGLRPIYQYTHQLAQPRLYLIMIKMIMVFYVLNYDKIDDGDNYSSDSDRKLAV